MYNYFSVSSGHLIYQEKSGFFEISRSRLMAVPLPRYYHFYTYMQNTFV